MSVKRHWRHFINILESVLNAAAPIETVRVKKTRVNGVVGKLLKRFTGDAFSENVKLKILHVNQGIIKGVQHPVQNLIWKKWKEYFEEKLKANSTNPKKLYDILRQLGLPNKRLSFTDLCLQEKEGLTFYPFVISDVF